MVNSAFDPSKVGKSSTGLLGWGFKAGHIHLCQGKKSLVNFVPQTTK